MTTTNPLPRVSVVMPVWNGEKFIAAALRSIADQDYPNLETLVVDDGSHDQSLAIAGRFPAVRCLRREHGGIGAARNSGLSAADGDLLTFLDADDLWTSGRLHQQVSYLTEHPEIELLSGQTEQFLDQDYRGLAAPPATNDGVVAGAVLMRRAALTRVGLFNEQLRVGEWIDWLSRAEATGVKTRHLPEVVLRRRIHGQNTVIQRRDQKQDYLAVIRSHMQRRRAA